MEENKDLEQLIPHLNVNLPVEQEKETNLVSDQCWLDMCSEILNNLRQERQEVEEVKNNLAEMVFNDGDSTSASKEALTKCIEIKAGISEKMTKVLDLATRVKLKEKDTFPRYLAQNNTINLDNNSKRELLKTIDKLQKKKKKEEENG